MEIRITIECSGCGEEVEGEFQPVNGLYVVHPCKACIESAAEGIAKKKLTKMKDKIISMGADLEDAIDNF